MYVSHFGLQQAPFSIAPDPRYLYMSERHREALAHLLFGVGGGGGFVLLTGEIGAGKTTVCRCFLEQVPEGCQVAYIFNPKLSVIELLQSVCDEFGIAVGASASDPSSPASVKTYIDFLNRHLLAAHALGRHCVLVIDEAQNLSAEVLEQLRLLTNLETNERKLLQIMLIGQPELRDMLAGPGLEQLAQRVIARYHLGALTAPETSAYIAHRLAVAGRGGTLPFDAAALRRIHQRSGGVPRRINLLADRALLGAYAEGRAEVGRRTVDRAAAEVFDQGPTALQAGRWRWLGTGLVAAAGVAVGALLLALGLRAGIGGGLAGAPWAAGGFAASASASAVTGATASALSSATASAAVTPASSVPAAVAAALSASAAPTRPVLPAAAANGVTTVVKQPAESALLDASLDLTVFLQDEASLLRELGSLWGVDAATLGPAEPCQALRSRQLRCFRSASGSLALLRQLDRPVLLVLHGVDGQTRRARLLALGAQQAVLQAGDQALRVPLDRLANAWRGEFVTLWRPPAAYAELLQPGAYGTAVDVLAQGLAAVRREPPPSEGQRLSGPLARQLAAFQVSQSLRPDGIAGPTTFMLLNRLRGVAEPRLAPTAQER